MRVCVCVCKCAAFEYMSSTAVYISFPFITWSYHTMYVFCKFSFVYISFRTLCYRHRWLLFFSTYFSYAFAHTLIMYICNALICLRVSMPWFRQFSQRCCCCFSATSAHIRTVCCVIIQINKRRWVRERDRMYSVQRTHINFSSLRFRFLHTHASWAT